jgi:hypothetical protein
MCSYMTVDQASWNITFSSVLIIGYKKLVPSFNVRTSCAESCVKSGEEVISFLRQMIEYPRESWGINALKEGKMKLDVM